MSLLVQTYIRTPGGEIEFVAQDSHSDELAGFESYRRTLYGSEAALSLGLQLLPNLVTEDIYAEGADLKTLRLDVELALANIARFEAESGSNAASLIPRFKNIAAAIARATDVGGGVVIW